MDTREPGKALKEAKEKYPEEEFTLIEPPEAKEVNRGSKGDVRSQS
jgi:hypothetical protein